MRAAGAAAALMLAACGTTRPATPLEAARTANAEAVEAARTLDTGASRFVVVQEGRLTASASLPDDAVRAADRSDATVLHRFVFRPADRGPRRYRLAYVAEGGVVLGQRFLADLGLEASVAPGRPALVRRRGATNWLDLAKTPRLAVVVSTLDGAYRETLSGAFDADFDGGLLLAPDVAARFALERFEIPGDADVQVALGRPFTARRATVLARIDALAADAPVEAVYEAPPSRR